jgi:hypothetical protein
MDIPVLNATLLQRVLQSGRTKPCIFLVKMSKNERGQAT